MTNVHPIQARYLVTDDFIPVSLAQEMRADIEDHFGNPYRHTPDTHMIWNYWHVPGLYTYFRTLPAKVFRPQLMDAFETSLLKWSTETLGFKASKSAYLSLYVDGCRQTQHNDSKNGRFGFVYSLTKNVRKTSGGETLIWREDDYFETRMHRPCASEGFFEAIEPRFNRLVVFDDRIPHAVQLVEGNMDPLEGRIVLHGHIREAGPIVCGPLPQEVVGKIADEIVARYAIDLGDSLRIYHGPAAVRFTIQTDGCVRGALLILDRVRRLRGEGPTVQKMLAELVSRISQLHFPSSASETVVTLPLGFG